MLRRRPGLSNAELARRSLVTPQSTHDIVLGLIARGLLIRRADPDHGRVLRTSLAPKGRALITRSERTIRALERRMLAGLSDDAAATAVEALRACVRNLGAGL